MRSHLTLRASTLAIIFAIILMPVLACSPDLNRRESGKPSLNILTASIEETAGGKILTLVWPRTLRRGDIGFITLTVKTNPDEISLPKIVEPFSDIIPSLPEAMQITEAKLDMPRMFVQPAGIISQPYEHTDEIVYEWRIVAHEDGIYSGTVWFYLYIPLTETNTLSNPEDDRTPVAALPVEVRVVSLVGMSGRTARIAGAGGLFLGILLAVPYIAMGIEWAWKKCEKPK